mmetsp:Transcript_26881/g.45333  ORF Transcript_26881/g.45333 Transcript_26881/m.45333 type:complete len:326 (-) Transcript_26881:26-1003(-)
MAVESHEFVLVATGFSMGLLHVLAGPDHLSALAALAVGTSWRAFMLGFRWGIGHSTGLVVVAIVFIVLKGDLDLRALGRYCDGIVGVFMIALGCYGVMAALKIYREKRNKRDPDLLIKHPDEKANNAAESSMAAMALVPVDDTTSTIDRLSPYRIMEAGDTEVDDKTLNQLLSKEKLVFEYEEGRDDEEAQFLSRHHHHSHKELLDVCPLIPFIDMHDPTTQRIVSFSIGLLHGVAGPGGILGVLPAVEMQNWRYSCLYLGSFILTSTLSMGTFAALYGEVTKRIGATAESMELALSVFSSAMSIVVGTVWLVLSLVGKLDTFFH